MRLLALMILGSVLVGSFAVHNGTMLSPSEIVERLANQPEVNGRFEDPDHGRFDAAVFLFTCIILAPIAGLALVLVIAIGLMALEGTVFQVSRRVGMADSITAVCVTIAVVAIAWNQADMWLPRSLRLLGMIARAWVVSTT